VASSLNEPDETAARICSSLSEAIRATAHFASFVVVRSKARMVDTFMSG
jgi:hypothetical protein